jgi:hypothetical protein
MTGRRPGYVSTSADAVVPMARCPFTRYASLPSRTRSTASKSKTRRLYAWALPTACPTHCGASRSHRGQRYDFTLPTDRRMRERDISPDSLREHRCALPSARGSGVVLTRCTPTVLALAEESARIAEACVRCRRQRLRIIGAWRSVIGTPPCTMVGNLISSSQHAANAVPAHPDHGGDGSPSICSWRRSRPRIAPDVIRPAIKCSDLLRSTVGLPTG